MENEIPSTSLENDRPDDLEFEANQTKKQKKIEAERNSSYSLVSLIDLLSSTRISVPVFGEQCVHPHICFDQKAFVSKKSTACPICESPCKPEELIVDKYVQNIINKTPDNILAVKIFDDDSWEACDDESVSCSLTKTTSTTSATPSVDLNHLPVQIEKEASTSDNTNATSQTSTKKTVPPFRVRAKFNKTTKYITITNFTFSHLKSQLIRKFPKCIKSNDEDSKTQFFLVQGNGKLELISDTEVQQLVEDNVIEIVMSVSATTVNFTMPASLVRWFWWDDDQKWKIYGQPESDTIEKAFVSRSTDKLSLVNGLYSISISGRTQIRPNTGKVRKIIRGTWFWTADSGTLVPYDEKTAAKLEAAYQELQSTDKSGSKTINVDSQRYVVIKSASSCQYNRTGNSAGREVKRGFSKV